VPEPRRRSASPRRRILTRYLPIVAVAAAIAIVVALVSGGGGGGGKPTTVPGPSKGLPLTFDEAQAKGVHVNWGPNCDPNTGRVAVPLLYAPPCVEPWKGGSNGGATAPGVTADTITVALYQAQPDPLAEVALKQTGSDESLAAEARTVQAYVDFFQSHYETYGRRVRVVPIKASGTPDDDVTAKADADRVANELHAFASFGGPSLTNAYADELAAKGVLCLAECVLAETSSFLQSRAPYVWPSFAAPDQAALPWAQFVISQLSGRPAIHAGDPKLRRQRRVFGDVRFDDGTGIFDATYKQFAQTLARHHTTIADDLKYVFDLTQDQQIARTLIASLKTAHVTTVFVAADPIFPSFLTKEATAQGYFPEWVVLGYAYTDTAVFGRTYDQRQWAHAFGVSLLPARTDDSADQLATVLKWQTGRPPEAKTFRVLVQAPLIFFTGLHLAGPHLTAATFRDGLFRYPADRPMVPTIIHTSWGRHGIWPSTDYTWGDDLTVIWWDPNATGSNEVGDQGRGLYRYALSGRRYLPGHWPADVGLYDTAHSTTVLHTLTADERPPSYPSPASGRR
jgi:hypothetical protein